MALVRGSGIITVYPLPLSTQVFRLVMDKMILLSHFLLVYIVLMLFMRIAVNPLAILLFIPALFIYVVAAVGVTLMLSVLGARYRDIAPALSSIMVLFFMITPVFWRKETLGGKSQLIADFNPFYHLLEIGRSSLLGKYTDPQHWIISAMIAVVCLIIGSFTFAVMRRRIFYWL